MTEVINHPDIAKFCIIRQDYVAITNGNYCAALLLSIFEGYNNWLSERKRSLWIDQSGDELSQAMCGLYSRKAIMTAGALLERLGLVRRKHKSSCDRTYQYLFIPEAVQQRINLATFWDATLKLAFWRIKGAVRFTVGIQWLKSLWRIIIPTEPMHNADNDIADSQSDLCTVKNEATSINIYRDSSNHSCNDIDNSKREEDVYEFGSQASVEATRHVVQLETIKPPVDLGQSPVATSSTTPTSIKPLTLQINGTPGSSRSTLSRLLPRVGALGIPDAPWVRSLLASVPLVQAEMNILALEEEAAANGLQSPAGALEAAIRHNWQAKRSPREIWWQAAGQYWGKERRNALIQAVTEWNGQVVALLANGKQIAFEKLGSLSWESVENLSQS